MTVKERKWFKRSRSLLKKPAKHLTEEGKNLVAFGMRNFHHFRTKILLVCAKDE